MTRFGVIRGSRICCAGLVWSKNCLAFGWSAAARRKAFSVGSVLSATKPSSWIGKSGSQRPRFHAEASQLAAT